MSEISDARRFFLKSAPEDLGSSEEVDWAGGIAGVLRKVSQASRIILE